MLKSSTKIILYWQFSLLRYYFRNYFLVHLEHVWWSISKIQNNILQIFVQNFNTQTVDYVEI